MAYKWMAILVASAATFVTRVTPFALFGGKRGVPDMVKYLGMVLPPAIIATLIVYCLKDINWARYPWGLSEIIAALIVVGMHLWKRNTLLSMAAGTIAYMIMIQYIFA